MQLHMQGAPGGARSRIWSPGGQAGSRIIKPSVHQLGAMLATGGRNINVGAQHENTFNLQQERPAITNDDGSFYMLLPPHPEITDQGTLISPHGTALLLKPGERLVNAGTLDLPANPLWRGQANGGAINPFSAMGSVGDCAPDCSCVEGKHGFRGGSSSAPPTGGGVDSDSYWKVMTQGGPLILAAFGDYMRAHSTAASLYGAGTYSDEPLGTQDPDSWTSAPMEFLVPGDKFGKELTPQDKQELDHLGAMYAQGYFWGKIVKYAASIAGNVAAMHRFANDTTLSEEQRAKLVTKNYYDWIGNMAFGIEKVCYAMCLGSVALAQSADKGSAMWHVGYLSGAAILAGALALANVAWYGKVMCGFKMLGEEKEAHETAKVNGTKHDIDTASLQVAGFNLINAVPRFGKHMVAHITGLMLLGAFYARDAFQWVAETDYVQDATQRLGGTGPEHLYRWMNFGFRVPMWLVIAGGLCAGAVSVFNISINYNKARGDFAEHRRLNKELRALKGEVGPGYVSPDMAQMLARSAELRKQHVINGLGLLGGGALMFTAFAVTYPALEPHALAATALYGGLTFIQYNIREWGTVKAGLAAAPGIVWNVIRHPIRTIQNLREKRRARKAAGEMGFLARTREAVREAREIVKARKKQKKAEMEGMSFRERWSHRWTNWKKGWKEWRQFIKELRAKKKADKQLTSGDG